MHAAMLFVSLAIFQGEECRYSEPREASADVAGATRVVVTAGSGRLEVVGVAGLRQARVRGKACASDRGLLSDIRLTATRNGNELRIRANDQDHNFRNREYARLDVVIEVPAGMDADIEDGSGELDLMGLGGVVLTDGSGSISGEDLGGIDIEDGSGEIVLRNIKGDVRIEDGSGEIDLRNVQGKVDIRDGSGEITLLKVLRDVLISDSSGGIEVDDVGGSFTVRNDSSGSISHHAVKGAVDVPSKKRRR